MGTAGPLLGRGCHTTTFSTSARADKPCIINVVPSANDFLLAAQRCTVHNHPRDENASVFALPYVCSVVPPRDTAACTMSLYPVVWPLPNPIKHRKLLEIDGSYYGHRVSPPSPSLIDESHNSGMRLVRVRCKCCGCTAEHCRHTPRHFADTTSRVLHKLPQSKSASSLRTLRAGQPLTQLQDTVSPTSMRNTSLSPLPSRASFGSQSTPLNAQASLDSPQTTSAFQRKLASRRGKALMISGGMPLNPKAAQSLRSLQEKQLRSWTPSEVDVRALHLSPSRSM